MVGHLTVSIGPTETWAGINTVKVPALLASWTVRVDDTLRLAFSVRVPEQPRGTRALTLVSHLARDGPWPTGVGAAWVSDYRLS